MTFRAFYRAHGHDKLPRDLQRTRKVVWSWWRFKRSVKSPKHLLVTADLHGICNELDTWAGYGRLSWDMQRALNLDWSRQTSMESAKSSKRGLVTVDFHWICKKPETSTGPGRFPWNLLKARNVVGLFVKHHKYRPKIKKNRPQIACFATFTVTEIFSANS